MRAFLLPGFALAAHTQVPLCIVPLSNALRYKTPSWFITQPQQSTKITLHSSPPEECLLHPNIAPPSNSTLATNTQPYPGQLHFLTGTHIFMKAASCEIASLHSQVVMKTKWWNAALILRDHTLPSYTGAIHKGESTWPHGNIELGLPWWELATTTTMLPDILKW